MRKRTLKSGNHVKIPRVSSQLLNARLTEQLMQDLAAHTRNCSQVMR